MTDTTIAAIDFFKNVADTLERATAAPYGPPVDGEERTIAGHACVDLCGGDKDKGRALWKLIAQDLGYMPSAAAAALIRAAATNNLIPDIDSPEPQ